MKYRATLELEAPSRAAGQAQLEQIQKHLAGYGFVVEIEPVVPASPPPSPDTVIVHTDGGCDLRKDGIGAWAFRARHPSGKVEEFCGALQGTTNNRMEMMAVIAALEHLEIGAPVRIVSDSEYVVKGITQWARNWVRNGWLNAEGKPVVNKDLWQRLLELYQLHDVRFEHVRGHNGDPDNERVDEICTIVMTNAYKALLGGEDVPCDNAAQYRKLA